MALLTMITIALMSPPPDGALARSDAGKAATAAGPAQRKDGVSAKRSQAQPQAQPRTRVSPSDLSDIAASMRASRPQPPGDGSYRVYVPGRTPLSCFGVGGIVTCQ
ncbi:hypothetical protein [Azospirillum sp.]|uniref:hypothetical protein n=1 Tax=Azospirillum sp. TaxID=34012 RepID=UPI003D721FE2